MRHFCLLTFFLSISVLSEIADAGWYYRFNLISGEIVGAAVHSVAKYETNPTPVVETKPRLLLGASVCAAAIGFDFGGLTGVALGSELVGLKSNQSVVTGGEGALLTVLPLELILTKGLGFEWDARPPVLSLSLGADLAWPVDWGGISPFFSAELASALGCEWSLGNWALGVCLCAAMGRDGLPSDTKCAGHSKPTALWEGFTERVTTIGIGATIRNGTWRAIGRN